MVLDCARANVQLFFHDRTCTFASLSTHGYTPQAELPHLKFGCLGSHIHDLRRHWSLGTMFYLI
ncbi:hypothetical protein Pr1d_05520 [Bythopirellula goksoeyrii]|uniref:Uncharacterized protein n=1 Tax=Bythopirellula goksoeyrii TaxID=1400387 RepID=A0A5B9QG16_9BACT|nr:hypothetical protein Pr1d_05520 [Bythopirellula goksoeyrii]